ncbi:histone-fold-containing protein [Naematelia encephala]|uniref:Histone-fold-containing protein n=1 Tax=Naematelia encephala TaxID=71784 RepID=A0A1Y2ANV7_9TREE|nr:histone-fold-containing protein [Naematelia encephala]
MDSNHYQSWQQPIPHIGSTSEARQASNSHAGPSTSTYPSPSTQSSAADVTSIPIAGGPLVEPHQDLNEFLESFWTRQMDVVEREDQDGRNAILPLARIKKVMKSDEDVRMISAEVPIMFSKACEIFISELTCRAWLVAESHKRRTLQKSDVAAAISISDMFDFLIDIVPRGEDGAAGAGGGGGTGGATSRDDAEDAHGTDHDGVDIVGNGESGGSVGGGGGVGGGGVGSGGVGDDGQGQSDGYGNDSADVQDQGEAMYSEYVQGDG